jgi:hypothetical protein
MVHVINVRVKPVKRADPESKSLNNRRFLALPRML